MALKGLLPALILTAEVYLLGVAGGRGPSVLGKLGGSAVLKCSLAPPAEGSSGSLHVVEWVRQGFDIPVLIKFGSYAPRVHPNYEGRVSLSGGTALRVEGLVMEDEGWYECRILLLDKPSDETRNGSWTLLSVTAPPVFDETPPPITEAYLGRSITLKCVARGNPPPTISWYKEGILLKQTDTVKMVNGSLSVGKVSRQTAGQYQCQASNSEGNATQATKLRVRGPPVILIPPKDTVLNMSQDALLQCQAEADPPNMTYVWTRDGENVYHIESLKSRVKVMVDGTLLISGLIPKDSGNYTCMPTNGLPAPPTASARLTVQHPALVIQMPEETFLPTGMRAVISCPLAAEPPLLRVDWSKDGQELDMGAYPGWTLTTEGSIIIATANDDAAGVYTCTPYNSHGTMGQSEPTTVILLDPPSLSEPPRPEYRQEVGRTLMIPCQAEGDPPPKITWTKTGSSFARPQYSVSVNGSLVLQTLSKEHYGRWECSVSNRVATVTASTTISVLGTSPHAVSSVSVEVEVNQANVSWEPGFDGGFTQTFTIWLKCTCSAGDQQEWQSVPGPSSGTSLLVDGLLPSTEYQFSVLAQNKLGSGPFSEISSARTLDALPVESRLQPPTLLSFNRSADGVYLWWAAPSAPEPPIDSFILQSRLEAGQWLNLDEDIGVNQSEMLVLGLQKNSNYELRLLSRRGHQLSPPSRSINVSTSDLDPTSSRLLEFVPKPLLAGVMGGMGFLCLALLLALATVCVIGRRRSQRRRKMMEDIPPDTCKSTSMKAGSTPDSPDSILKQKLLPPRPLSGSASFSSSDHSSLGRSSRSDYHGQRQQLLPRDPPRSSHNSLPESHLHISSNSPTSPVEFIHRGPDGRFVVEAHDELCNSAPARHAIPRQDLDEGHSSRGPEGPTIRKSQSLSYRDERRHPPFVLSVDMPACGSDIFPPSRGQAITKHLSLRGYSCQEEELAIGMPQDQSSLSSEGSGSVLYPESTNCFGKMSLNRESTRSTASTLVLQMEHEREQGNLSRCLRLAQEREELERELRKYNSLNRDTPVKYSKKGGSLRVERRKVDSEEEEEQEAGQVWTSRGSLGMGVVHQKELSTRGNSLPAASRGPGPGISRAASCIPWEARPPMIPMMSSNSMMTTGFEHQRTDSESLEHCHFSQMSNHQMSHHQRSRSLERREHQKSQTIDRRQRRRTLMEGQLDALDSEQGHPTSEGLYSNYIADSSPRIPGTFSPHNQHLIVPNMNQSIDKQQERNAERLIGSVQVDCADSSVEMSVDEPEEEEAQTFPSVSRSTIDHSHDMLDYQRPSLHHLERWSRAEREAGSRTFQRNSSRTLQRNQRRRDLERLSSQSSRTLPSNRPPHYKALSVGSQRENHHKSTPSLDSKLYKKQQFLAPDAWIDSLSLSQNSSLCLHTSSPSYPTHSNSDEVQNHQIQQIFPNQGNNSLVNSEIELQNSPVLRLQRFSPEESPGDPFLPDSHQHDVSERHSPTTSPVVEDSNWSLSHNCHTLPERASQRHHVEEEKEVEEVEEEEEEEEEDNGPEVDVEIQGYPSIPEPEGSCRSYASQSSGRGSLDHPSSRQSLSLSPPLTSSPETTEESDRDDAAPRGPVLKECPRRASVDESYEWDSHYVSTLPADEKASAGRGGGNEGTLDDSRLHLKPQKKGLFPSAGLMGDVPASVAPSCEESVLARDILHGSTCFPDPEQDGVLF